MKKLLMAILGLLFAVTPSAVSEQDTREPARPAPPAESQKGRPIPSKPAPRTMVTMPSLVPDPQIDYKIQVMTPDPRIDYKILSVGPTQPPVLTMPNPRFQGGNPPRLPRMHRK